MSSMSRAEGLYAHRDRFVRTARAALFGFARGHAQDLVSDVLLDVGRGAFPALPDADEGAVGFVHVVIRHRARHINRREARSVPLSRLGPELVLSDFSDAWERCAQLFLARDVATSLARLTPRQREIATLHWMQQRSSPEIAAALGISTRTVKELLRRARRSLCALLEHHRPGTRLGPWDRRARSTSGRRQGTPVCGRQQSFTDEVL